MKQAIQKLREEILKREKTIEAIENFKDLDLSNQLKTIQESDLRYNTDFKLNWAENHLMTIEVDKIKTGCNDIEITIGNYKIVVPVSSGNYITLKEIEGYRYVPKDQTESIERNKKRLENLQNYNKRRTYKNFVKCLTKGSSLRTRLTFYLKKGYINRYVKELERSVNSSLRYSANEDLDRIFALNYNEGLKRKREKFLKTIEKDMIRWEKEGIKAYKTF